MPQENQDNPGDPRVYFAAERTLLAWLRTGLAMMGFGFVVARFGLFLQEMAMVEGVPHHKHSWLSVAVGTALIVLGVAVSLAAAVRHWMTIGRLERGQVLRFNRWSLGVVVAMLLGLVGLLMAAYLIFGWEPL